LVGLVAVVAVVVKLLLTVLVVMVGRMKQTHQYLLEIHIPFLLAVAVRVVLRLVVLVRLVHH
jgi:hypothetical protein